jgi:hypothetical protein
MLFEITGGIFGIVLIHLIGRKLLKRHMYGEIAIGLIIGFLWEILTSSSWNYGPRITILTFAGMPIPLEIILGWGSLLPAVFLLNIFLQKKLVKTPNTTSFFIMGLVSIFLIAIVTESFGYNAGYWTYVGTFSGFVPILNLPVEILVGWFFYGTLFLAVTRVYHRELEAKFFGKPD